MLIRLVEVVKCQEDSITIKLESSTSSNICLLFKHHGHCMMFNNSMKLNDYYILKVTNPEKIKKGQCITLSIDEKKLLIAAILIYITPLFGIFLVAGLFQVLFYNDFVTVIGALLGAISGFIIVKIVSRLLVKHKTFHPLIININ